MRRIAVLLGVASAALVTTGVGVWYHAGVIPAVDPPDLLSKLEPSSEPVAAPPRFRDVGIFCGWGPDGMQFSDGLYETSDGRRVSSRTEWYRSERAARRAHRKNIRDGDGLASPTVCGPASDLARERAVLTQSDGGKRWTVVTWREGKQIHSISSEFPAAVLDLEAEYCEPRADS